jgi:hypothetical protein
MSKPINDGGPAFPELPSYNTPPGTISINTKPGMSLRDWFAGQALAGMLGCPERQYFEAKTTVLADWSYQAADAMLAARKAKQ